MLVVCSNLPGLSIKKCHQLQLTNLNGLLWYKVEIVMEWKSQKYAPGIGSKAHGYI